MANRCLLFRFRPCAVMFTVKEGAMSEDGEVSNRSIAIRSGAHTRVVTK